jgi:hypothetical protein
MKKKIAEWVGLKLWWTAVRLLEIAGMPRYQYAVWGDEHRMGPLDRDYPSYPAYKEY